MNLFSPDPPTVESNATSQFVRVNEASLSSGGVFWSFAVSLARWELLSDTPLWGGYVAPSAFDWTPVVIGLTLGIIAGVFRAGAQLEHDSDGLV